MKDIENIIGPLIANGPRNSKKGLKILYKALIQFAPSSEAVSKSKSLLRVGLLNRQQRLDGSSGLLGKWIDTNYWFRRLYDLLVDYIKLLTMVM